MTVFLRWLENVTVDDRAIVGGKAAVLGSLMNAGFLVPNGFCITAFGFARFGLKGCIPPKMVREIQNAYHRLAPDGAKVAVRSSGTAEDSSAASFAGQYETRLNVENENDLLTAIYRCWEAADSARVQYYREKQQVKGEAVLPLLVQRMIPAQVSGVLFTVDPLSGVGEAIIEAVVGLGDDLVSGKITPDRYRVTVEGEVSVEPVLEQPLLTSVQCHQLADLGWQAEAILGEPQDMEWALYEGQFHLLQARPVTISTLKSITASNYWTRANIGEVLPDVVTPLTWSVFRQGLLNRPLSIVDGPDGHGKDDTTDEGVSLFSGRAYLRLDMMLGRFCGLPGVTTEVMRWVLGVEIPKHIETSLGKDSRFPSFLWGKQAMFVFDILTSVPLLKWRVDRFGSRMPLDLRNLPGRATELDEEVLKPQVELAFSWVAQCFQLHLRCTGYAISVFGLLSALLRRYLPSHPDSLLPIILTGREDLQTATQGRSLWRLAKQAQKTPALEVLLMRDLSWQVISHEIAATQDGQEFLTGFDAFLSSNGARAVGEFELRTPRWREDPGFLLKIIRGYLQDGRQNSLDVQSDQCRRLREDSLAEVEGHLKWWQKEIFRRLLHSYSICVTLRENMKYRLMEGYYVLRQLFLALGEKLRSQGVIETVDDIFFLTASEAIALACGDKALGTGTIQTVQERRNAHALWANEDAPFWVTDSHLTPVETHVGASSCGVLEGIACSPGQAKGRARVLKDLSLVWTFQPGEILVAPSTDPGWTPLFLTAAGIVTEIGGFLSHGATVAREYGVPAVVSVSKACAMIKTGDLLTVDGDAGVVVIHQGTKPD